MSATVTIGGHPYPAALVRAAAAEAALDAGRVAAFLAGLGLHASPDRPVRLPAGFLLSLGAALRLPGWEAGGHAVHRDAGLPTAADAVRAAFRSLADPAALDRELWKRVFVLTAERFSWHAREALGAEVVLDALDPDAAAEAVARFLWAARRVPAAPDTRPEA